MKIKDTSTACCHAPVVRETAGDEYYDYCSECGKGEPAIERIEVPNPIIPNLCSSRDHWFNMIVEGRCEACHKELATALPHKPAPTDEELDMMHEQWDYERVESERKAYQNAH